MITKEYIEKVVFSNFNLNCSGRFYVYGLFYKKSKKEICFYIGKGCGNRYKQHLKKSNLKLDSCYNPHKVQKVKKLKEKEHDPYSEILFANLSEQCSLDIENFLLNKDNIYSNVTNILKEDLPLSGEKHPLYGKERSIETRKKISKLDDKKVKEIKWLLENSIMTNKEISKKYDIHRSTIQSVKNKRVYSNINSKKKPKWYTKKFEKSHKNRKEEKRSILSVNKVKEIKWIFENTKATVRFLSKKYDVCEALISNIKNNKKFSHVKETNKPDWANEKVIEKIEKKNKNHMSGENNPATILLDNEVKEIKWLISNTNLSLKKISDKYDVTWMTISSIKNERSRNYITNRKKPDWYSEEKITGEPKVKRNVKLTKKEVSEIKYYLENKNIPQKKLAEKYNISSAQISHIKNERSHPNIKPKLENGKIN